MRKSRKKYMLKTLLNVFKSYICLFFLLSFPFSFVSFVLNWAFSAFSSFSFLDNGFSFVFALDFFTYFFPFFNKIKHLKHDDDFSKRTCSQPFCREKFVQHKISFLLLSFFFFFSHFLRWPCVYAQWFFVTSSRFCFRVEFIWIMKSIQYNRYAHTR